MYFTFQSVPGVILTVEEVCEELAINYLIRVEPDQLKNEFLKNPHHDFFKELQKWPGKFDDDETSDKVGARIREAATRIGFSVEKLP